MTAAQHVEHTAAAGVFTPPRRIALAAIVCSIAYGALIIATDVLTAESGAIVFLLVIGGVTTSAAFAQRTAAGRVTTAMFAIAMLVRSFCALAFHVAAVANDDPFGGSPDAWSYYSWASTLAMNFRHGSFPAITGYYQTGRWDVGYYYVLGAVYAVFGNSLLIGRLLGGLFGALAVVMVLIISRRLVSEKVALGIAIVYALWPMSIGWATESVLRDAFVWFLLLAATWLAIRFFDRPRFVEWLGLFAVLSALRYTRGYAVYFFYAGLGVVLGLAILDRRLRPRIVSRAVPVVVLLLAVESFFLSFGFPNVVQSVRSYDLPRWIEKPIPTKIVQLPSSVPASSTAVPLPRIGRSAAAHPGAAGTIAAVPLPPRPDTESETVNEPPPQNTGLIANAVRLVLGPFGWTFYLPGHSIWPVYSVWPWYLLIPAAAIGAIVILRRGSLLPRALVIVAAMYMGALWVIGRGDAIRQRETIVPFLLMIAFAGVAAVRNRRRILVPAYVVWIALLGVAIGYHIHTLRGRRFSPEGLPLPSAPPAAASPQARLR